MNNINLEDFKSILQIKGTDYVTRNYSPDIKMLLHVEDILDWNIVSTNYHLTQEMIDLFCDKINFINLNIKSYFTLDEGWLRKNLHLINFEKLSYRENLSIDFIRDNKERFYWNILCLNKIFSENEIEEFEEYVSWTSLMISHSLTESFLLKHKSRIDVKFLNLQNISKDNSDFKEMWEKHSKIVNNKILSIEDKYKVDNDVITVMSEDRHKKLTTELPKELNRVFKLNKLNKENESE